MSPYDTFVSAALRFVVELIAWVAGPWAVFALSGQWVLILPTAALLIGLPAVFSAPGDKRRVIVPTPGPARLLIEMFLVVVAVAGSAVAWPKWAAIAVVVIAVSAVVAGLRRAAWLANGARRV